MKIQSFLENSWFPVPFGLSTEYERKFPPYVNLQPLDGIPKMSIAQTLQILTAEKHEKELTTFTQTPLNHNSESDKKSEDTSSLQTFLSSTKFENLFQLMQCFEELFSFTAFTCLIYPFFIRPPTDLTSRAGKQYKNKVNLYKAWNIFNHSGFLLFTLYSFGEGITFIIQGAVGLVGLYVFCNTIGVVIQNILLYPAVCYIRKSFLVKREIELPKYLSVISESLVECRRLVYLFNFLMFAFITLLASLNPLFAAYYFIEGLLFSASNYFMVGVFFFLIIEQRVTYQSIDQLYTAILEKRLTRDEYLRVQREILSRDSNEPINLFAVTSLINLVIILLLIWSITSFGDEIWQVVYALVFILSTFGRQFILLVLLLLEVLKVNSLAETMLKQISADLWEEDEEVIGELDTSHDDEEENNGDLRENEGKQEKTSLLQSRDHKRVQIYILLKEHPVGSNIFGYRPTRLQLIAQLASVIITVLIAILKTLFFTKY
jgi:hypothetical protein